MTDRNERAPAHASPALETPPSALCVDCPQETCLMFELVDYWGQPVLSPARFELDGKPAEANRLICGLPAGPHILKAVDGQDLRVKIRDLPHMPRRRTPSPAEEGAKKESKQHMALLKTELWDGVELITEPSATGHKFMLEITTGIDYYILMVFLDNHSGGLHGTGHAGVFIINGQTKMGKYAHFGPYYNGLGTVEVLSNFSELLTQNGAFNENKLAKVFHIINENEGSGIISKNCCIFKHLLCGPAHGTAFDKDMPHNDEEYMCKSKTTHSIYSFIQHGGNLFSRYCAENLFDRRFAYHLSPGFSVNGLVAWAAYALPSGSYDKMGKYILKKQKEMSNNIKNNKNGYDILNFNCMDFSVAVLNTIVDVNHKTVKAAREAEKKLEEDIFYKGKSLSTPPLTVMSMYHPNDHIQFFMDDAHDAGIFDGRKYRGEPEAVSQKPQVAVTSIRHHKTLDFYFSLEKLRVK